MSRVLTKVLRLILPAVVVSLMSTTAAALSHEEWVTAFVRFVDWPTPTTDTTLTVCQQHDTPTLELDGRQVRGLKLKVRRVVHPRELVGCHVYAALASDEAHWVPALKIINQAINVASSKVHPILAVGHGAQFCDLGGAICLVKNAMTGVETYRLNLDALARAGFRVDSQLLRSQPPRATKAG